MNLPFLQETEFERDIFAGEINRLRKIVKKMKTMQSDISCENRELTRLKDRAIRLELQNQQLESCISVCTSLGFHVVFGLDFLWEVATLNTGNTSRKLSVPQTSSRSSYTAGES